MSRPLQALIRLDHLRHNYRLAKALHGGRALAVIKANAYGHSAVRCAQALADEADGFAVACIEEAIELREAGISAPILLLEGFFDVSELADICRYQLWTVVHHEAQLSMLEHSLLVTTPITVWLKMNSGMNRVGFAPAAYREAYQRLQTSKNVAKIVMMSHFARADEPDVPRTAEQIATFDEATAGLNSEISLSNSAGVLNVSPAHRDWGRPGIMLYGSSPFTDDVPTAQSLKPVMKLQSRVIAVRELPTGQPIGYGGGFVTSRPTRVGVVACGYADGYPRVVPAGTPIAVDGQRTCIIGRVSMDMMTVDLTDLPESGLNSEVELWGDIVNINEIAAAAGTISYELLCNVKRAHFAWIA